MATQDGSVVTPQQRQFEQFVSKAIRVQHPICMVKARGARMWDESGREYLDFAGSISSLNVGHCHPRVVRAVQEQAERLIHTTINVTYHQGFLDLAENLCRMVPISGDKRAMLTNSGSEAVEAAVKAARQFTGRSGVITFTGGYHGKTFLALGMTSQTHPYKSGLEPFPPEIHPFPYPDPDHCPFCKDPSTCSHDALTLLEQGFSNVVPSERVAAVVVEPVQGEGGIIVPPADFLPRLREICRSRGILFIVDEIQTGLGRVGKMFAIDYYPGLDPDIVLIGKSLGAGLPISAAVGRAAIMDAPESGSIGSTFSGNPVAAAAALQVLQIVDEENLPERAMEIGAICMERLSRLATQHPRISSVRGLGAMIGIELVRDRKSREPWKEGVQHVLAKAQSRGLILPIAGIWENVVRLLMPLVITPEELDRGLAILEEALVETLSEGD
ncbi:MAG: aspartate aminotransferase family protein [Firmicutes bacterium]|nr:aspartate aminotransferase family protein [Bacillota bacterium]